METTEIDLDALARNAYSAYGKETDFKMRDFGGKIPPETLRNFRGDPMPEYEQLPEKIQQAWVAAALSVVKSIVKVCLRRNSSPAKNRAELKSYT